MENIKTYQLVDAAKTALSFELKRMEDIYAITKGQPDHPHRHNYYIVLLVKKGRGKHIIDFNEFNLNDKQLFFLSPGQVHQLIEKSPSNGFAIMFSDEFLLKNGIDKSFIDDLYLFNDYGHVPPLELTDMQLQEFSFLAEKMIGEMTSNSKFKYLAIGAWLKLFLIQAQEVCTIHPESNTQLNQASITLLSRFKLLLETHYKEWHQVNQYANALHITSDHLNSTLKSLTGKNAKSHIQDRIILNAKRLLLFSDYSTKEIAYELGFSEPGNFSQFFKKCTSVSPSKFKSQHQ